MITAIAILVSTVLSIMAFQNRDLFVKLLFNPYYVSKNKEWYRFFTHAFIHGDWAHLLINMYVLYSFGRNLEDHYFHSLFDSKYRLFYILLYIGAILSSSYPSFEKHKNNPGYSSVGASGAVSAVVFSWILINPTQKLIFLFLPFPIPGFLFGIMYLAYSWYMAKKQVDNIGHDAHFWGAVYGFVFTSVLKPSLIPAFFEQIL